MATYTYDLATPVGQVRLLATDRTISPTTAARFSDEELAAFLALEGQSLRRAAAAALEMTATDQVLLLKVLKSGDQQTDGSKVSAELRALATQYRLDAEDDDARIGAGFDWAEQVLDPSTARQRIWEQAERQSGG